MSATHQSPGAIDMTIEVPRGCYVKPVLVTKFEARAKGAQWRGEFDCAVELVQACLLTWRVLEAFVKRSQGAERCQSGGPNRAWIVESKL